jgi:O-antigen/teichoic acid export membrane protein
MLPVFVLLSFYWAKLDSNVVALACIIVVSEQVFNFAYNISLVDVRYRVFVFLTAFKSVCLFLSLAMLFIFERSMLTLHVIFLIWAIVSGVFSLAIAGLWQARRESLSEAKRNSIASLVFSQHRASLRHFLIGALAVLALQVDRIAVGALLPLEQVGVYFRHIVIISFIYQFFNVASYSRKMSDILHVSRNVSIAAAQKIIFREYAIIASLTFLGMFGLIALDQLLGIEFSSTYSLDRGLAVLLVAGTMVKVLADFFCIILNAHMREHMILKNQLIAVPAGALALVILTLMFGLYGAALALGISSTLYLLLNHLAVRSLSLELNA